MGLYKLTLPKMGESVTEATLTNWLKNVGDRIQEDEAVVEIATDKVDSDVPSPVVGILKEKCFEENQTVQVGEIIAIIEVEGQDELSESDTLSQEEDLSSEDSQQLVSDIPGVDQLPVDEKQQTTSESEETLNIESERFYSPLVKSIAQQEGITRSELETLKGTGADDRVTKDDILRYIESGRRDKTKQEPTSQVTSKKPASHTPVAEDPAVRSMATPAAVLNGEPGDEIIEMDRMRRLIADHMVHSAHTSPHVFSVVEADVTNLVKWRNKVKDAFKKREGENITFTPLIIEAISKALKDFPMINVSVDGYNIIKRKNINIGMATALPSGNLIVPVIKNADQLSLVGISHSVNDLANRARNNKLKPDDTQGGTFTFTNIGAFGNIFGMPIINQPQAAILAVGAIKKKPAVIETEDGDMIGVRHFMYITMSYDHRVIDGALGGTFIKRVSDYLEAWDLERTI